MRSSLPGIRFAAALGMAALGGAAASGAPVASAADGGAEVRPDRSGFAAHASPSADPTTMLPPGGGEAPTATRAPARPSSGMPAPRFLPPEGAYHEFFFTRAIYSDGRGMRGWGRRRGSWSTDYPKADHQFLVVLQRLVDIDAYGGENAVALSDPELRRYPFLYALEVGRMSLSQEEVEGLRSYLEAGGFLVIDDFWGRWEWANFEREMARVFPGRPIEDIPLDHPLFNAYYDIGEVRQVPVRNLARRIARGYGEQTWECAGCTPRVRGIFDDERRLMVVINFNTDLGDAWEWAEDAYYPLEYSTYAFEVGVNMIVYAMSH